MGEQEDKAVRTRIAPSPTGEFHIGGLRTLLFNWAYAKKNDGKFIIRIEDTDRERFVEGSEERTLEVIKNYGLDWDEGPEKGGSFSPYRQSERLDIYKEWVSKLVDQGNAYYCFCSKERLDKLRKKQQKKGQVPKYDGRCRTLDKAEIESKKKENTYVVRMRIPENEIVEFEDSLRGVIKTNSNDLDDQVILKSDGFPTYHLAVVVDDALMKITNIIRGEEWLPSTPKHVLLYKWFEQKLPVFTHVTVLLNPEGKGKLSKRHGGVSARYFLDEGYLPEAVLNFLMLLGWAPKNDQEFFSLEEFVNIFNLKGLQLSSPAFNRDKLAWMNGEYIRKMDNTKLASRIHEYFDDKYSLEMVRNVTPLVKERIKTLKEFASMAGFFFEDPGVDEELFGKNWKKHIKSAIETIENTKDWELENLNKNLMKTVENNDFHTGKFFMDLRIAITGKKVTPPINDSLIILGKEETLERLESVLEENE